jgi:hypothetical protein
MNIPKRYWGRIRAMVNHAVTLPDYEVRIEAAAAEALANGVDPVLVAEFKAKLLRDIELHDRK